MSVSHVYIYITYTAREHDASIRKRKTYVNVSKCYGVATISRLLKIKGLFCRMSSFL